MNAKFKFVLGVAICFAVAALAFSQRGQMLVSCWDGAFILHEDNSRTPLYTDCEIKYGNDAKVGPDGRFYIGTQSSKYFGSGDEYDGKLYSIDKEGNVRRLLDVPTPAPASCCFAGDDMDKLIIVTASYGLNPEADKYAGCTFITHSKVKGRKPY